MSKQSKLTLAVFAAFLLCALVILSALFPVSSQSYLLCGLGGSSVEAFALSETGTALVQDFTLDTSAKHIYLPITPTGSGQLHVLLMKEDAVLCSNSLSVQPTVQAQELTLGNDLEAGSYHLALTLSDFESGTGIYFPQNTLEEALPCRINGKTMDGVLGLSIAAAAEVRAVPMLAAALLAVLVIGLALFRQKRILVHLALAAVLCAALAFLGQLVPLRLPVLLCAALGTCFLAGRCYPGLWMEVWQCRRHILQLTAMLAGTGLAGAVIELLFSIIAHSVFLFPRCCFWCAVLFVVIYHWVNRRRLELAASFLVVSLCAGFYLSFFQPAAPLVSWDDEVHYSNTVYLSQGINAVFSKADLSMRHRTVAPSFSLTQAARDHGVLEDQTNVFSVRRSRSSWMPDRVGYLPFVLGIWLGQVLSLPFWLCYCMGRAANVLFCSLCFYFAIRRLKSGRLFLYLLGLLPTGLFLAANYSYDAWVTALMTLGFAWFVGALQRPDEKLSFFEIVIMLGAVVIGCLPKAVYGCVIPIMLLMPRQKFGDTKAYRRYLLLVIAATGFALLTYLVPFVLQGAFASATDTRGGDGVSSSDQIAFIFSHPMDYTRILLTFLAGYLSPLNSYQLTCFMAFLGGLSLHIPVFLLMLTAALFDRNEHDLACRHWIFKAVPAVFLFGTTCLIATALYLTFNAVGSTTIDGCQPRYLLPLLYPAAALIGNVFQPPVFLRNALEKIIPVCISCILFAVIWVCAAAPYTV